jgi:hypothetical protein
MASYVQLGRGFRSNFEIASFHPHRRRPGGRGAATTLGIVAAVFAAGLLLGRLEMGSTQAHPTAAPQPMQFYPR